MLRGLSRHFNAIADAKDGRATRVMYDRAVTRELRGLVPFEAAAVVAAAIVALPIPKVVPLLVVASLSLYVRGHSWAERLRGPASYAAIGAGAGCVGLGLAIVLGTPLVEALSDHAVQWSMYPIVRGSGTHRGDRRDRGRRRCDRRRAGAARLARRARARAAAAIARSSP